MSAADQLCRLICLGSEPIPTIEEDRERQLLARGVTVREPAYCAWCDKEEGIVRPLSSGASHGLCARHLAAWEAELGGAK